jgi:V/A-type H+-transporting ATPase subunit I
MIVKMKKLTLLCTSAQQEQTLNKLRDLKVLHVQHVKAPEGNALEKARNHLQYVQRAQEVLTARPDADPTGNDPDQLVDTVWKLLHLEKELKDTLQSLEHEVERIAPFGDFEPRALKKLNEQNLVAKLCAFPIKDTPEMPKGVAITEISRSKNTIYVLAVAREDFLCGSHEVRIPDQSLTELKRHIDRARKGLEETEAEFQKYAGDKKLVDEIADSAADTVHYLEVQNGMGADSAVVYLKGFYPVDRESDIEAAAKECGWGYTFEEVSDDDEPPTLLRNPKWVSPIKAALDMIGVVPGYKELDVSALFLIFLSVFFAFIIGDAGYGLLFIGLTLWGKVKTKGNAAAQPGLNLLMVMSVFCVVFGALTGNYFGIQLSSLPGWMQALSNNYMTGKLADGSWDPDLAAKNIMFICFSIGTVHISIAHVWNFIRKINSWGCLTDLGWLCCTWMLYGVVLNMVLNVVLPTWVTASQLPMLGTGIGLIIVSLVMSKSYFGLVTLALDVINNFVDIISYVRLYAVGAASLAIAQAFNGMAMDMGFNGAAAIGAALILFAGHALNIILGAMGVMVHGIRLNTLEFSSHAGVEWAGLHFNPFRKNNENL